MGEGHADALFSAAVDGVLGERERRQLDEHLAACTRCATAFEGYRRSIDGVRSLPQAAMPVPVRLPPTPPAPLPAGAAERLRRALATPLAIGTGAGVVAAAAAVAVAVAVARPHDGPSSATLQQAQVTAPAAGSIRSPAAPAGVGDAGAAQACEGGGQVTLGVGGSNLNVQQGPSGFSNATASTVPGRPGELLMVATSERQYHPGERVHVNALLLTPSAIASGRSVAGSCVRVTGSGDHRPAATMDGRGAGQPVAASGSDLSFTVPRDLPPGTALTITATIPQGVPDGEAGSLVAVLVISVR